MNRPRPATAEACVVGNANCPGTHACLFLAAGVWRSCGAVVFDQHEEPATTPQPRVGESGQELAA